MIAVFRFLIAVNDIVALIVISINSNELLLTHLRRQLFAPTFVVLILAASLRWFSFYMLFLLQGTISDPIILISTWNESSKWVSILNFCQQVLTCRIICQFECLKFLNFDFAFFALPFASLLHFVHLSHVVKLKSTFALWWILLVYRSSKTFKNSINKHKPFFYKII